MEDIAGGLKVRFLGLIVHFCKEIKQMRGSCYLHLLSGCFYRKRHALYVKAGQTVSGAIGTLLRHEITLLTLGFKPATFRSLKKHRKPLGVGAVLLLTDP